MKKIKKILTPLMAIGSLSITSFGLVGCGYKMSEVTKEVLDEFMGNEELGIDGLNAIPRPCEYHDAIVPYLKQRIKDITNLDDNDIHVDGASNIYFDLPASQGYESKDMVILQGHTDMVVAGMTKEQAKTTPIETVIEKNLLHSVDYKTSIGADNGIGISIMLYLAKHINDFNHGPLRFLMSADEDCGMVGASKIDSSWLKDSKNEFIKYLINVDCEKTGCIYSASSGNVRMIYSNTYETSDPRQGAENVEYYEFYFDGLKGGHSAMDILDKRANADRMAFALLHLLTQYQSSQTIVRLVLMDHESRKEGVNISYGANQLIANSHMIVATNLDWQTIDACFDTIVETCKNQYTGENYSSVSQFTRFSNIPTLKHPYALTSEATKNLADMFGVNDETLGDNLNSIYYGVFDDIMNGDLPEAPMASGNIGPIELIQDESNPSTTLSGWTSCRTLVGEMMQKLSVDWLKDQYEKIAKEFNVNVEDGPIYNPWPKDETNDLIDIIKEGYKQNGVEPFTYASPGGVECSWWYSKTNKTIKCACIGPQIDNAHSETETLHIDTIDAVIKTIYYALNQLIEK